MARLELAIYEKPNEFSIRVKLRHDGGGRWHFLHVVLRGNGAGVVIGAGAGKAARARGSSAGRTV